MKVNEKEIVKNRKWLLPLQLGKTLEWAKAMYRTKNEIADLQGHACFAVTRN